jgi:PHD/YefM family antitoxin component YafN of YafNO toxin-antitoxin module
MTKKRARRTVSEPERHSLSAFQRNASAIVRSLQRTGRPAILTVRGRARLVVQAAEAYERMLESLEHDATVNGLREGLQAFERGEGVPALEALEAMRKKHGLSRAR